MPGVLELTPFADVAKTRFADAACMAIAHDCLARPALEALTPYTTREGIDIQPADRVCAAMNCLACSDWAAAVRVRHIWSYAGSQSLIIAARLARGRLPEAATTYAS